MPDQINTRTSHWKTVYQQKSATAVSWYRPHLELSLSLLREAGLGPHSRVIDIGGGASTLVDDLLAIGVGRVSVLDLSDEALSISRDRLGALAGSARWMAGDITSVALPKGGYTHWHDRAVLHFLSSTEDLEAYAAQAAKAVISGGCAVIGGFAPDGPERCSGLSVVRRTSAEIAAILEPHFRLVSSAHEIHQTPGGAAQSFTYALMLRE